MTWTGSAFVPGGGGLVSLPGRGGSGGGNQYVTVQDLVNLGLISGAVTGSRLGDRSALTLTDAVSRALQDAAASIELNSATLFKKMNGAAGVVIGSGGIAGYNSAGTATFTLDPATGDVTLSGTITATAGAIGGFTLGATTLTATSGGNTTTLSSGATAFSAGPTASPTVTITQAGILTATEAIITPGEITVLNPVTGASTTVSSTGIQTGTAGVAYNNDQALILVCSDETTALTAGAGKFTFHMPYDFNLKTIRASLVTPQAADGGGGIFTVDVNQEGTSILTTPITIDNTEYTSRSAATVPVLAKSSLCYDARITVDIDQIGDGSATGLKVYLIGAMYSGYGLIWGGINASDTYQTSTIKYNYAMFSQSAGTAVGTAKAEAAAAANETLGVMVAGTNSGGSYTTSIEKYTFATDVTAASAATISGARARLIGVGNSTKGIFGGGNDVTLTYLSSTSKYTYATDATAAGGALPAARTTSCGVGTSTIGYIAGGALNPAPTYTATIVKYTYSSDTAAGASPTLSVARDYLRAVGNQTVAYFGGGAAGTPIYDTLDKYTYAADTCAASSATLNLTCAVMAAIGGPIWGAFSGGVEGDARDVTTRYNGIIYATDTVLSGTLAGTDRWKACGVSSLPGGF